MIKLEWENRATDIAGNTCLEVIRVVICISLLTMAGKQTLMDTITGSLYYELTVIIRKNMFTFCLKTLEWCQL